MKKFLLCLALMLSMLFIMGPVAMPIQPDFPPAINNAVDKVYIDYIFDDLVDKLRLVQWDRIDSSIKSQEIIEALGDFLEEKYELTEKNYYIEIWKHKEFNKVGTCKIYLEKNGKLYQLNYIVNE